MDGVLVETGESFPAAIRATVEREWAGAGFTVDSPGYSPSHEEVLKRHGAFNDDYDIAWVLLNIAASRTGDPSEGRGKNLSFALPDPQALAQIVSSCKDDCVEWMKALFGEANGMDEKFERGRVRELASAAYFGDYGDGKAEGAHMLERPLLEGSWRDLPLPVYIYTGRDLDEWRLAQKILSWQDFPDDRVVHRGTGMQKPSPAGLEHICRKFGHYTPFFFGDTMSDKKSHEFFGKGVFVSIGGLLQNEMYSYPDIASALSDLIGWGV